jgi:hypothetical protein
VISFVPVTTRIDEKISRRYVPEAIFEQVADDEEISEASGDDTMDILPAEIDLLDVFAKHWFWPCPITRVQRVLNWANVFFPKRALNRCGMRMQNPLQGLPL